MSNIIHSRKSPQFQEQNTSVTVSKVSEDEQITVADISWSEETKERIRQADYDDMDMIRAWYS